MSNLPGFVDYHTHLLRSAAGGRPSFMYGDVEAFHRRVAAGGSSPMDERPEPVLASDLAVSIAHELAFARSKGLVEVWETGLDQMDCLWTLLAMREAGDLDTRVRIMLASGVAERDGMPQRTGDDLVEVVGVKFYADGWLGPRTCAMSHAFADESGKGLLFIDAVTLAKRMEPFANDGWAIATHAIGDQAIESVLDAYQMVYGDEYGASGARIEHGQVLRPDLIQRIALSGVRLCIQPTFLESDREHREAALGESWPLAYGWAAAFEAGCRLLSGSDYPLEPINGVDNLVLLAGQLGADGMSRALGISTNPEAGQTILSGALSADPIPEVVGTLVSDGNVPSGAAAKT